MKPKMVDKCKVFIEPKMVEPKMVEPKMVEPKCIVQQIDIPCLQCGKHIQTGKRKFCSISCGVRYRHRKL